MKKPIAILLLAIQLFNLGGYSLVFHYFMQRSHQQLALQLDKHNYYYSEAELVEVSIPLGSPYIQSSNFERVDGSLQKDGIEYNYVKRRVHNDTLYLMCLPNKQKTSLAKTRTAYSAEINDFAANKKQKEPVAKKPALATEYHNLILQYHFVQATATATEQAEGQQQRLFSPCIDLPVRPPQSISC